jgi:hypothetical protein
LTKETTRRAKPKKATKHLEMRTDRVATEFLLAVGRELAGLAESFAVEIQPNAKSHALE